MLFVNSRIKADSTFAEAPNFIDSGFNFHGTCGDSARATYHSDLLEGLCFSRVSGSSPDTETDAGLCMEEEVIALIECRIWLDGELVFDVALLCLSWFFWW